MTTVPISQDVRRAPRAVMHQTWSQIVWCHWPIAADAVAAVLPPGLVPELFDGTAWIGLIPFSMSELRLPGRLAPISALAGVGAFGEVNVRTYVIGPDGRSGVWFCTLDADRLLAVLTARVCFGLPYRRARTELVATPEVRHWTSRRRGDGRRAELRAVVAPEPPRPAAPGLETFLIERYALYTSWHGRLARGELTHEPWRVRAAHVKHLVTETVESAGFTPSAEPHVLVGEPVHVTVHPLRLL